MHSSSNATPFEILVGIKMKNKYSDDILKLLHEEFWAHMMKIDTSWNKRRDWKFKKLKNYTKQTMTERQSDMKRMQSMI